MVPGQLFRGDTAKYAGAGMQFAATIGVFGLGGYYLDEWLGSSPWLMIVCIFLGAMGGFIHLVWTVSPPARRAGARANEEDPST